MELAYDSPTGGERVVSIDQVGMMQGVRIERINQYDAVFVGAEEHVGEGVAALPERN